MAIRDVLRRRSAAPLGPGFGALIGDLDGPIGRISPSGVVCLGDQSCKIEWGVRCADRWRLAHEERAVRQNRVDDTPVYETWLRVPGGDVIQRVAVLNDGRGRSIVVEYENDSAEAVMVATVGRAAKSVEASLECVVVGSSEWIRPQRPAGAVAVSSDIWAAVTSDAGSADAAGHGDVAMLHALPHRQKLVVVVGIEGQLPSRPLRPTDAAAGWRTVTARSLQVEVPDLELTAAWRRIVCDLILAAGDTDVVAAGEAAWWLDLAGLHDEADRARRTVLDACDRGQLTADGAVVALRALASRDLRTAEPSGLDELAGPLARVAGSMLDRETASIVARALEISWPKGAADALRLLDDLTVERRSDSSLVAAAAANVLGSLFRDGRSSRTIQMLPEVPAAWDGQPIDVRGLATGLGTLSFSVRWHGDRPAALWERVGGPDDVMIACGGFGNDWSTNERNGEALLDRR